jgi:hypothetical protein
MLQPMPGSIIGLGMGLENIHQQLHLCKSLSLNRAFWLQRIRLTAIRSSRRAGIFSHDREIH